MKKIMIAFFAAFIMISSVNAYAKVDCVEESWIDHTGDWFATFGKKGIEKDKILARRKAERIAKCTREQAEKAGKQLGL